MTLAAIATMGWPPPVLPALRACYFGMADVVHNVLMAPFSKMGSVLSVPVLVSAVTPTTTALAVPRDTTFMDIAVYLTLSVLEVHTPTIISGCARIATPLASCVSVPAACNVLRAIFRTGTTKRLLAWESVNYLLAWKA